MPSATQLHFFSALVGRVSASRPAVWAASAGYSRSEKTFFRLAFDFRKENFPLVAWHWTGELACGPRRQGQSGPGKIANPTMWSGACSWFCELAVQGGILLLPGTRPEENVKRRYRRRGCLTGFSGNISQSGPVARSSFFFRALFFFRIAPCSILFSSQLAQWRRDAIFVAKSRHVVWTALCYGGSCNEEEDLANWAIGGKVLCDT
jgi:hypothetical protein